MEADVRNVSIGFVRTYSPTVWRLTTCTESLIWAVACERPTGNRLGVVGVGDDTGPFDRAGEAWNTYDLVSIQMELGILAGPAGAPVLDHLSWTGPAGGWPRPSIGRRPTGSPTESTESATVVETGEARLEAVRVTV